MLRGKIRSKRTEGGNGRETGSDAGRGSLRQPEGGSGAPGGEISKRFFYPEM